VGTPAAKKGKRGTEAAEGAPAPEAPPKGSPAASAKRKLLAGQSRMRYAPQLLTKQTHHQQGQQGVNKKPGFDENPGFFVWPFTRQKKSGMDKVGAVNDKEKGKSWNIKTYFLLQVNILHISPI
jgi:hypothetical protein